MKITIVGAGYVGLSLAVLLSVDNEIVLYDIDEEKTNLINNKKSPIHDIYIEEYLQDKQLNLLATTDMEYAYNDCDYVLVAVPTNYDDELGRFNTKVVEYVINDIISINSRAYIIIKSTLPVGFTVKLRDKLNYRDIAFSPEFLREGKALFDNLYPSRIIVGDTCDKASKFAKLLKDSANKEDVEIILTGSTEAESIKLFSNTYLAMRVAFFNELDTYANTKDMDTSQIIKGVCLDPRIGDYYNNPSFGYGGYCLPKDSKQLLANFNDAPQNIITAIVDANKTRKEYIANKIIEQSPNTVGIYRLTMKTNSDNFRYSSIQDIMRLLIKNNIKIIIYEPVLEADEFDGSKVIKDLDEFKNMSDIILANRVTPEIYDTLDKVYTRDIYKRD